MNPEQILEKRLKNKGFHSFGRHLSTGMLSFFGPDGYKKSYEAMPEKKGGKYILSINAQPVGTFEDADDIADFILV